jgi:hypothetical protein
VRRAAIIAVTVALASPAGAGPYARPARVAYLARALEAVTALGPEGARALEDALRTGARRRCRSSRQACLIDVARATCERAANRESCHLAADIILTNQLSETELVDEATRLRLLARGVDFRAAIRAELRQRYTVLVAELALAEPEGELPARIDRFCAGRALAWQRCAAAIVWYIGAASR